MTNSEKVREFSSLVSLSRYNKSLPTKATRISTTDGLFLTKMVLDELIEFLATLGVECGIRKETLKNIISKDVRERTDIECPVDDNYAICGQADAIVDIEYYMKDMASRYGINVDKIFDIVHKANMNKRNVDGYFTIRYDGKVIKPINWKSPDKDIEDEIKLQITEKSF